MLYKHGRTILDEKEAAIRALEKFLNRGGGTLRLSSSTIPGEFILPRMTAAFHSRFPDISVEMHISDSSVVCEEILAGKAEPGFVGAKIETVGLEFRHLASDELALVVPNNGEWDTVTSIPRDRLAELPFLAREPGSATRIISENRLRLSFDELNLVGYFGSTCAVKEAIKAGLGVSVLSLHAVRPEIESAILKAISIEGIEAIKREFYTVRNKMLTLSPAAETFLVPDGSRRNRSSNASA